MTSILDYATDPTARRATDVAYHKRAMPQDAALLEEAIGLRAKLAHLLGYANRAAYVLDDRMAKSVARVDTFLDGLDAKLTTGRTRRRHSARGAQSGRPARVAAPIEPDDFGYYDNVLRKTTYAVADDAIRQYFPVRHVERAVFDIYSKLLRVPSTQRSSPNVWAPDVPNGPSPTRRAANTSATSISISFRGTESFRTSHASRCCQS